MNQENNQSWDLIIEGKSSLFDFSLRDVWRYRDLLWILVKRDFVSFYKHLHLRQLGRHLHRQNPPTPLFPSWYHRLELFCGLPPQNIHSFQRQRQHLWQSIFPPHHHALEHCGKQLGTLWCAIPAPHRRVCLLPHPRTDAPTRDTNPTFPCTGNPDGDARSWIGSHHHSTHHQVPRPGILGAIWGAVAYVCHHSGLPTHCGTGEIPIHHRTQPHDGHH